MKLKLVTAIAVGLLCTQAYADMNADAPQTMGQSMSSSAGANKQEGDKFLMANKANKGVVTLSDGLQYKILKEGTGAKPTDSDTVEVEYAGRFIDGTEFDSSGKHGGSISFPVGQVIPGWTEALKLMPVGSVWEVYIPSQLAYGDQGVPPTIGPNKTLIFKITLKDIKK